VTRTPRTSTESTRTPIVAFQGIPGAFGEAAIRALWPAGAELECGRTFRDSIDATLNGVSDWTVLPIWNSTIGDIDAACAELERAGDALVRERSVEIPVHHCLMALPGTSFDDVRYAGSHPAALGQCSEFLKSNPSITPIEACDTAGAAQELAAWGTSDGDHEAWFDRLSVESPRQLASLGSVRAAELYGLVILQHNVQNDSSNLTRFVAVRRRGALAKTTV
jgi:prephenate dehydratase